MQPPHYLLKPRPCVFQERITVPANNLFVATTLIYIDFS